MNKYTVIRDTREQIPWEFTSDQYCDGFIRQKLDAGDYSIVGYENIVAIERKRNTGEIAANINAPRFEKALARLNEVQHAYMIFEFTADDVLAFPYGSGIPLKKQQYLKVSGNYIMSKIMGYMFKYPNVRIIFGGSQAERIAQFIFKKVINGSYNRNV